MIIDQPGKVTDRITLLGRRESTIYLLDGKTESMLMGGGMFHIVPDVLHQFNTFKIDPAKIQRLIIFHSHFDHCGIVPFFKKRYPWMTVTASQTAKDVMMLPKYIQAVQMMNKAALEKYGLQKEAEELGLFFEGITVEQVVKGGDRLTCGDRTIEIIDVPGHSACSIAAYVPEEKALFASDAGGIPFGKDIFTAANSDFDKYQESLKKMAAYPIEVYLAEHYGARTGDDGRRFLDYSIADAEKTRKHLIESLSRTKDVKKSTEEITDEIMKTAPSDFLPKDVIAMVSGQMLKYLSKQNPSAAA